jgi:hypothetical protein
MSSLTVTMHEMLEQQREKEWRRAGVDENDIRDSSILGMHPVDVRVFRDHSLRGYLFIIRLPKLTARVWHGFFPPKIMAVKAKTGDAGVVVTNERVDRNDNKVEYEDSKGNIIEKRAMAFVSDYDMMSVWRKEGSAWRKIFISAAGGRTRGNWQAEAKTLVRSLNQMLVSRLQHGCQDDYHSSKNPGVKNGDRFGFFLEGKIFVCGTINSCAKAYEDLKLDWPYDMHGTYCGPMFYGPIQEVKKKKDKDKDKTT